MADSYIQLPPNSTGLLLDTSQLTVGANTVQRERDVIADPTDAAGLAKVENADPAISDYGVVVRPVYGNPTNPMSVSFGTATSGGATPYHKVSAGNNNAALIKGSAGQVYGWKVYNNGAYPVYVKLYNETTNPPTPASDTPFITIGVQAGTQASEAISSGIAFGTGIGIAIVKGIADNDNTAVLANDCVADIFYK